MYFKVPCIDRYIDQCDTLRLKKCCLTVISPPFCVAILATTRGEISLVHYMTPKRCFRFFRSLFGVVCVLCIRWKKSEKISRNKIFHHFLFSSDGNATLFYVNLTLFFYIKRIFKNKLAGSYFWTFPNYPV